MKRRFLIAGVVVLGLTNLTCGKKKTSGDASISVSPTKSFLLPGNSSSCKDIAEFAADPSAGLGQSVGELRLFFPSFQLNWSTSDTLFVAQVKVTIESPSIAGGKYECKITGDELSSLLGLDNATLERRADGADSSVPPIKSNDAATRPAEYPPCGLTCGGVQVQAGSTTAFSARGRVELVGFSVKSDQTQVPVKATTDIEVELLP